MAVPYTSLEKVQTLVARAVPSRPGTAASIDETQVLEAIQSAQQRIDSKLGRLYSVPFEAPPPLIRDIATALAAYDLDLTFREVRDYSSELNPVLLRQKQAEADLKALADGTATIPGYDPPDGEDPEANDPGSVVGVFNPDIVQLDPASGCGSGVGYREAMDRYYGWTL